MDVDPQDEELSNLHVDLLPVQSYLARQSNLSRDILAGVNSGSDELFEE
jgi:hypothetical protein